MYAWWGQLGCLYDRDVRLRAIGRIVASQSACLLICELWQLYLMSHSILWLTKHQAFRRQVQMWQNDVRSPSEGQCMLTSGCIHELKLTVNTTTGWWCVRTWSHEISTCVCNYAVANFTWRDYASWAAFAGVAAPIGYLSGTAVWDVALWCYDNEQALRLPTGWTVFCQFQSEHESLLSLQSQYLHVSFTKAHVHLFECPHFGFFT